MSHGGHFNKRHVTRDKLDREIKTFEDFRSAPIRHSDGSEGTYRRGTLVPGTYVPSKHIAKEDVPAGMSKFYPKTEVTTIVADTKKPELEKEDKINRVKKNLDVNAPSMRL